MRRVIWIMLFVSLALAARHDGFGHYRVLIQGDVIFNEYDEQLRVQNINMTNDSAILQMIDASGAANYMTVIGGQQYTYGEECILIDLIYSTSGNNYIELTWSPNPCILEFTPTLYDLFVAHAGKNSAVISWLTNLESNASVIYWSENASEKESVSPSFVTEHSITLRYLRPSTTYYFKVKNCNEGNNSNCTLSVPKRFITLPGDELDPEGLQIVEYPLHMGRTLALQGFIVELIEVKGDTATISLKHDGEELCSQQAEACRMVRLVENVPFGELTGMHAKLMDIGKDTAIMELAVSSETTFPPSIIVRPIQTNPERNRRTRIDVFAYDVNPEGRLLQANLSYEENGSIITRELVPGQNAVSLTFQEEKTYTLNVDAVNDIGKKISISKKITVVKPIHIPSVPSASTHVNKASASPTPIQSNLEQIRQEIAEKEARKGFDFWSLFWPFAAVGSGIAIAWFAYFFLQKRKSKANKTPPKK
ncbi:fibronectin type III domain-containing protein [Candidatus Micrarchaeota archaeon]|nr:fibronectin type III domain-containing protein [Candidatus Micrarchaeota archaeon]